MIFCKIFCKIIVFILLNIYPIKAGISPVHDFKKIINKRVIQDKFTFNSPYKVLQHLDESILRTTSNLTQNPAMEENLYQLSKDLVSAILTKLEIQDKITRITREALDAPGKVKGLRAIETRRILDYISKTLSGHILTLTRASTEPELHRLVYGLVQIAAEVSIVSALKDITYAIALSKKQSSDLSLRKKRSASILLQKAFTATTTDKMHQNISKNIVMNPVIAMSKNYINSTNNSVPQRLTPYSVLSRDNKIAVHLIPSKHVISPTNVKLFLNKTALDMENQDRNESDAVLLENTLNSTEYVTVGPQSLDIQEANSPSLIEDLASYKDNEYTLNPDVVAEIEIEQPEVEEDAQTDKKAKLKMEKLELKAKKAILHAGDVAFLTAASVVAMRRALTASIEVQMSVQYAKSGMSNHQDLMMNLAKTAAQQAGKEAKNAASKSLGCERVIKLALKYTAQSKGAKLNHVATRITMETLSLATLAKSMAFVSSDIAINSLYSATDFKPPS